MKTQLQKHLVFFNEAEGIRVFEKNKLLKTIKLKGITKLVEFKNKLYLTSEETLIWIGPDLKLKQVQEKVLDFCVGSVGGKIFALSDSLVLTDHSTGSRYEIKIPSSTQWKLCCTSDCSKVLIYNSNELFLFSIQSKLLKKISINCKEIIKVETSLFKSNTFAALLRTSALSFDLILYDLNRNEFKEIKNCHSNYPKDLKFSPFNRYLLISVGLDCKYVLYDVEKVKVVRSVVTSTSAGTQKNPFPARSCSIHSDGVHVCISSDSNTAVVYDLSVNGKIPAYVIDQSFPDVGGDCFFADLDDCYFGGNEVDLNLNVQSSVPEVNLDQSIQYLNMFSPVKNTPVAQFKSKSVSRLTSESSVDLNELSFVASTFDRNINNAASKPKTAQKLPIADARASVVDVRKESKVDTLKESNTASSKKSKEDDSPKEATILKKSPSTPILSNLSNTEENQKAVEDSSLQNTKKTVRFHESSKKNDSSALESTLTFIHESVEEAEKNDQVCSENNPIVQPPPTVSSNISGLDIKALFDDLKQDFRSQLQLVQLDMLRSVEEIRTDLFQKQEEWMKSMEERLYERF